MLPEHVPATVCPVICAFPVNLSQKSENHPADTIDNDKTNTTKDDKTNTTKDDTTDSLMNTVTDNKFTILAILLIVIVVVYFAQQKNKQSNDSIDQTSTSQVLTNQTPTFQPVPVFAAQ